MDQIMRASGDSVSCPPIPFVRANALNPFLGFLQSVGAPFEGLLHQAHIPSLMLHDDEALLPAFSGYRFLELLAEKEHMEDVGLIVGQKASAFDLGAFGAALAGASNVYEYVQIGIGTIGAHGGHVRMWLTEEGDRLRISQFLCGPQSVGRCIADIYTLVLTLNMLRWFIGPTWNPEEVRLLIGNEKLIRRTDVFGDARVVPGQPHSSFTIKRSLLGVARPDRQRVTPRKHAIALGTVQPMPTDLASSIEALLLPLLTEEYPTIETAAEIAGMSARTLQRRLAEERVSYSDLVARGRFRLAAHWLLESDMPIAEIAAELGYTDASNFARAFRRRTGLSPSEYRLSGAEGERDAGYRER